MKEEDSRRFPQKRNGVIHKNFGIGIVTLNRHSIGDGSVVMVKFDQHEDEKIIKCDELVSYPSRGESPSPSTSRNSGWVGGNNYRRK